MNELDILLSTSMSATEWCEKIITEQKHQLYTSLTAPKYFNHVVKEYIKTIHTHLKKNRGITSFKELNNSEGKVKEALTILYKYIQANPFWRPSSDKPLCGEELDHAFEDLHVNQVAAFVKCDRKFNDPAINGQNYALYSFVPSESVKPDSEGLYGFIKIRGVFNRIEEAEEKSKELIQYFSANNIFICEVGKPTPLEEEVKAKENVIYVDNPEQQEGYKLKLSELVADQTLKDKKNIEDVLKRKQLLEADVANSPENRDPIDKYIELHVKRATNSFAYTKGQKQLDSMKNTVIKARKEIAEMDEQYPSLKDEYIKHYEDSKKDSGIDQANDEMALYIKEHVVKDYGLDF